MNKLPNFNFSKILFKDHAVLRMFERNISRDEVLEVINSGEEIEDYPSDFPFASKLIFKLIKNKAIHVVIAINYEKNEGIIVTLYEPDDEHFENDFKTRKKI